MQNIFPLWTGHIINENEAVLLLNWWAFVWQRSGCKKDICSKQFLFVAYIFLQHLFTPRTLRHVVQLPPRIMVAVNKRNKPNRSKAMRRPGEWNKWNDLRWFQLLLVEFNKNKDMERGKFGRGKESCYVVLKVKKGATFLFLADLYRRLCPCFA